MSDHYSGLHEGLAEAEELHQRMLECGDVKRVLMLQKLASGRYAFALERPTMTMARFVVGTTNPLNDEPHVNGCFVLEAAAMAAFQRDYGVCEPLRVHGAAPCVMLAALDLPGWLGVVGHLAMAVYFLFKVLPALEAWGEALEAWCSEREADADQHGQWHRKHAGADARHSNRFDA